MQYSFLMSVYYKEKPEYLKMSIDSMLNQTVKPDEIIIVKDGKLTKELDELIEQYKNEYSNIFTIVNLEQNIVLGLALNEGIKVSRNEIIARMDSDDISKPTRCEKQLEMFKKNEKLSICGTNISEFNDNIENITGHRIVPENNEDIYDFSKRRSAFNHPTVMYKKTDVLKYNGYSNLRRNQDVDLFGRMIFGGCEAYNIQDDLLWFRSDDNLSKRRKSWENSKSYIKTIKNFWKMGFSSFSDLFIVTVGQILVFILPIKFQKILYKKVLRKNEEN